MRSKLKHVTVIRNPDEWAAYRTEVKKRPANTFPFVAWTTEDGTQLGAKVPEKVIIKGQVESWVQGFDAALERSL